MKKLLVDVDDVVCVSSFLDELNKFWNTNYKLDDFSSFIIDDVMGSNENKLKFYSAIKNTNIYKNAVIIDGAIETLKTLSETYEIFIVSDCRVFPIEDYNGIFYKYKFDFLIKVLPFINPKNFIFTGAKHLLVADVMIDDNPNNLTGNIKTKLMMTAYHNKTISNAKLQKLGITRVNSWKDIEHLLTSNKVD